VNLNIVKKITLTDLIIVLGFALLVIGLGIKMKGETIYEKKSKVESLKIEKGEEIKIVIDINNASLTELEVLPAIGPKTAQKIIDYRNKQGAFKRKEEIKNVSGIGEKTYEKIKDRIEI
jgi:competence protein ComEA